MTTAAANAKLRKHLMQVNGHLEAWRHRKPTDKELLTMIENINYALEATEAGKEGK